MLINHDYHQQSFLDAPFHHQNFDTFFWSAQNQIIRHHLTQFLNDQGSPILYIFSPPKSGLSHLVSGCKNYLAQQETPALVINAIHDKITSFEETDFLLRFQWILIDNLQLYTQKKGQEEFLFHLINEAQQKKLKLLLTSHQPPDSIALSDLKTRLQQALILKLKPIEQKTDLEQAIHFINAQYEWKLSNGTISYLVNQFDNLAQIILLIEEMLASHHYKIISIAHIKQFVEQGDLS